MNKICTSIEQSQKLIEFGIDVNTADMRYHTISPYNPYPCDEIVYTIDFGNPSGYDIPCWSLAALLDVLPANKLEKQFDGKWWFSVYLPSGQHKSHKHDNPIDACVEVILNLHKLNLL